MTGTSPGGWPLRVVLLAGAAALGTTGSALAVVGLLVVVGVLAPAPRVAASRWRWFHGVVMLACTALVPLAGSVVALAGLAGWLVVHQAWQRTPDTGRVAGMLATMLLLAASIRTDSPLLAPIFIAWVAALPLALLRLATWEGEGGNTGPGRGFDIAVGALAVLLAGALFLAMPRLQAGMFRPGAEARGRFPEDMALGGVPLRNDELSVVMRVRAKTPAGEDTPLPWYIRARVLETTDGVRWTVAPTRESLGNLPDNRVLQVDMGAEPGTQLYGLGEIRRIEGAPGVHRVAEGVFHHRAPGQPVAYAALGHVDGLEEIERRPDPSLLQLPDMLPDSVRALAWSTGAGASSPERTVEAIVEELGSRSYEAAPPAPVGDPVAWFLFEHRAGHCEYFASALATMLRVRGVGARVATGFYVDEVDADGWATVRRGMAHAWVEVRTRDGWATVDATPPGGLPDPDEAGWRARLETLTAAWYRKVVDYDLQAQFAAWGALGRPLVLATGDTRAPGFVSGIVGMGASLVALTLSLAGLRLALLLATRPRRRRDPMADLVGQARREVVRAGLSWPSAVPPLEAASTLRAEVGDAVAEPLERFARAVYGARYGGDDASTGLRHARVALVELRGALRSARGDILRAGVRSLK